MESSPAAAGRPDGEVVVVLRNLAQTLRSLLGRIREGEARESNEVFNQQRFWDTLGQAFQATSQEATKLSLAFSKPPLPSAEDCQKLSEGLQNAVLAAATVYYWLPKSQGMTLRKSLRDAIAEMVEGAIQLTEVILKTPLQSLSQEQLMSTGGLWEACDQVSRLPRDNHAAVLLVIAAYLGVVKDALVEMEQAQVDNVDPFGDVLEDEELGAPGNQDTYWSEADRQLIAPCMGLIKASKACLKKVIAAVKAHGKADTPEHVAQLDDLADITNEVSPSVDELALSMYPPVNHLAVRFNAAKLASVLKKVLEISESSHTCVESEVSWIQFLNGVVDHNMNKIKDLTQNAL
ncbi:cyclin-D1-binding protein 1 isoform X2 [Rhinatrema bivittatum]|uniref:cyclin-D1-binding protein 1 isoform X2 n=1 Tax=Rhinatrema bivittatum TaxID=194408 RepID=UPI00112A8719|nr:cyclin-D1-binding protein 1 isoform X2 [Rhinatrema bivittatum]